MKKRGVFFFFPSSKIQSDFPVRRVREAQTCLHVAKQIPGDSPSVPRRPPPPPHASVSARPTQPAERAPSNMHASSCVSSLLHETTMSSFASESWRERPGRFRTPPPPHPPAAPDQRVLTIPDRASRRSRVWDLPPVHNLSCLGALCCCVVGSVAMRVPGASERRHPAWTAGLTRRS